jgi:hypothetical protein
MGTIAITSVTRMVIQTGLPLKAYLVEGTMSNSYATGGDSFPSGGIPFDPVGGKNMACTVPGAASAINLDIDATTGLVVAKNPANNTQISNATDLSATAFKMLVFARG